MGPVAAGVVGYGGDMPTLRLVTWNVLHRVHGTNWAEACLAAFPDEAPRVEQIASRVAQWLGSGVDAVCLQEVSGDQLAALRAKVSPAQVFAHRAPRMPRLRVSGPALRDPAEFLVTVVAGGGASQVEGKAFVSDEGKGALVVDVGGGLRLINTHVTHGELGKAQVSLLAEFAQASKGAVLLGDFNAPAQAVGAVLGAGFRFADLSGQGPTRVANDTYPQGKTIDHVIVFEGSLSDAKVLENGGLSDHHPVSATATFGS